MGKKPRIIATAIIKCGTGKTTTAAALAQAAAADGKKVLAVDLDPQCNLTIILGATQSQRGSLELLHNPGRSWELIQETPQGISVIPASPDLAAEKTQKGSGRRLREGLAPLRSNYDLTIIDTPPTLGELTFNALIAATDLLIPVEADKNSLQGLYQIVDVVQHLGESARDLSILGSVITRFDSRPKLNRYLYDAIKEHGEKNGVPLLMAIRPGVAIREAQTLQRSIFEYAPNSKPAQDYRQLYKIIMEA